MGKSVNKSNPYVLTDEVLNTLPSSVGTKTAQVKADNTAKNPYVLSTEVLGTIPEKKKTFDTGLTESSPSESTSELQSKENATDFLSQDIDNNDFFSQLSRQTDRYFPQTTPGRVNQQAAEMTKQEVFRNPGSLQRYADSRIKKIREEIANLKQDQREDLTPFSSEFSTPSLSEALDLQKDYAVKKAQILEKEDYINKLKSSVADVAADLVLSQQDMSTNFNPRSIGRDIIKIADPEQEQVFVMAEKNGQTLPGIRQAELERIGLNAAKNFVLKNTNLPNRDNIIAQINDLERDFDTRNFEMTGQRVREKIGAQLYKEGEGGFFGFGYPVSKLRATANNPATGLTDSEKKVFESYVLPIESIMIGTDVPTSGFTRSFYNAIEKGAIGMGNTIGDITGFRDESQQSQDLLNQEMQESRHRPPGENPKAAAQLSYLLQKEKSGHLTDEEKNLKKELERYTYVRNGWSRFKDGVGDLTGQVALIAVATKGIGATGQALRASGASGGLLGGMTRSTLGTALSNETIGLFTSSYLNAFDNYKQQAIQLMPGEDKAANRQAYATIMSSVEALSERIFRDTKVLDAFTKELSPAVRDIANKFANREITQQVAKEEMQSALTKALTPFAKEYAKSTFQESTEEAVVDFAQGVANAVFGGADFDIVKTGQQALNTFLTTALYSPVVAGMAAAGASRRNRSQNAFIKSSIVDMAANPAQYLKSVEDLQLDGTINQQQANEKIQLIKSANRYLQEIPVSRTVATKMGEGENAETIEQEKPFDYPETSSYIIHRLNEGILTEQINNTTDEVLKSRLQKDLKRSQEIRKGLFDGSIGVTTDLQDVTDNAEKAAELGIANADGLMADVLVGTQFENVKEKKSNEKEPEVKNAEAAPAEGEATGAEVTKSQTPQITDELMAEATQFANELKDEGIIPDTYHGMITEQDATSFWEMIAQQAQNVDANWQPLKGDENKSEQAAIDAFGESVVSYAKELFPVTNQIQQNETGKSQESGSQKAGQTREEGDSSIGKAEEAVLEQQGAEPVAEAPLTEEEIQKPLEPTKAKKVSQSLRDFADKIRKADITGAGGTSAQSDITRLPREVVSFAINRVADAIDAGDAIVNAIQKGVDYIREQGHKMDDESFSRYTTDLIEGKRPRIRVSAQPQETNVNKETNKEEKKETKTATPSKSSDSDQEQQGAESIEKYRMTTTDKVGKFLSGGTWQDVMGEVPEGDQSYLVQGLSDMLQDGKNMIAIAQQKWGSDEMMYGRPLFKFIQSMSNDEQLTNKKAVLLATFLGELQEAKLRSPERFDAISQLEKAVFSYYQNYMNLRGKEVVAGRLLRLYRDKYIGDIYADQILEEEQVKAKKKIQQAEQKKTIDDATAQESGKSITAEEKSKEDKEAKEKSKKAKKDQSKKKKLSSDDAKQKAQEKLKDIESKLGDDAKVGLLNRIKEAINKLNCK